MTPTRVAAMASIGLIGLVGLAACGSSPASSSSASSSSSSSASSSSSSPSMSASMSASASASAADAGNATITIKSYKYGGATTVPAGSKITVTNDDGEAHTLTSDSGGAFDVKIAPGKSTTFTAPAKAGSFPYHCTYHGNMHGTLKVS
jgi:plastocyanin